MKQEMMGWQWHQLDHRQIICTLLQRDNHSSTSFTQFFTGRMLFLAPTNKVRGTDITHALFSALLSALFSIHNTRHVTCYVDFSDRTAHCEQSTLRFWKHQCGICNTFLRFNSLKCLLAASDHCSV